MYFGKIPTELDPEQVHDFLFYLQKKSKTPSQTYFKHCVYGIRFLLKSEGLPYEYLRLPSIKHEKNVFTFLFHDKVPPDNNASERAIRNVKVKQKVSGQFKTENGAQFYAVIRSVTDTCIKNGQNVLAAFKTIAVLQPE